MKKLVWFERTFTFGGPPGMLPFYLERLSGTIVRLEKKVSGIPDDILSEKADGKWSVKQHIGHLAEVDEISLRRLDEIARGITPMSPAVFEPRADYNAQPVSQVIECFRKNRSANLKKYGTLSEADLGKSSAHPRLKAAMNPVDLAWFDAEHDDHHLVTISEILSNLK